MAFFLLITIISAYCFEGNQGWVWKAILPCICFTEESLKSLFLEKGRVQIMNCSDMLTCWFYLQRSIKISLWISTYLSLINLSHWERLTGILVVSLVCWARLYSRDPNQERKHKIWIKCSNWSKRKLIKSKGPALSQKATLITIMCLFSFFHLLSD